MEKDLKTQNTPWLAGIYVGAFLLMDGLGYRTHRCIRLWQFQLGFLT